MPKNLFSNMAVSLVLAFTVLSVCFAFSQALYSGLLREYAGIGTMLILAGSGINIIIISLFSDIPIAVARPQDEPFPLVLVLVQSLALHFSTGQQGFLTIFLAMFLITFITGLMLYCIGYFKLGNLIRFVPFPVIAGFLASAGLLLIINGIGQVLPQDLGLNNLNLLLESRTMLLWLPSLLFGILLFISSFQAKNSWLFPSLILGGFVLFYLTVFFSGHSISWLQSTHLLLEVQPISLKHVFDFDMVVHWSYLFNNLIYMMIIAFIASLALLFILVSLDLALRLDLNFNRELKIAGAANVCTAFLGGIIGYHGLANTIFLSKTSSSSRFIGIFCGLVCIAAIFFADVTLAYFPRFILSGLIIFLGLCLFYNWTFEIWHQFDKLDSIVVLIVIITSVFVSFLLGIISGFIISFLFFILTYSWISPIRYAMPGNVLASIHQRPPIPSLILKKRGKEIMYIKLQNYLFFGSVYSLVMQIQQILYRKQKHPIRFVIYDFERVLGIDSSVEMVFKKIVQFAEKFNFRMIFTGVSESEHNEIYNRLMRLSITDYFTIIPNLEDAINYCELDILAKQNFDLQSHETESIRLEDYLGQKDFHEVIPNYFNSVQLAKGEHVFYKNSSSKDLYYVESGTLVIYIKLANNKQKKLAVIGPGNFIGELAFYLHVPRTASVRAETNCVLKSINQQSLRLMANQDHELYEKLTQAIIFILAKKLSSTTDKLSILSI